MNSTLKQPTLLSPDLKATCLACRTEANRIISPVRSYELVESFSVVICDRCASNIIRQFQAYIRASD